MPPSATAYIGLGSNLDDPVRQVQRALVELAAIPATRLVKQSSLYRSPPLGPPDQPDYVNAVAELATTLQPLELLDELQRIENAHGRVRGIRWGARTLDLDLLLYGNTRIDEPRLSVPHPGLALRAFVIMPLWEIAPALDIPGIGSINTLVEHVAAQAVARL